MNTVLRVLVIVIALLGVTALVFAVLNFDKRQILLGRNSALVDQVTNIARTIEAQNVSEGQPRSAMLDVSDVTDRVLETPDKQDVLDGYPAQLEAQNLQKLNFSTEDKQSQLLRYYAIDEEGKVKKNEATGQKIIKGPGTMQELLDQLLERAQAQQGTLDKTRAELSKKREQVEKYVDEINDQKGKARIVKKDLTDARTEIASLTTIKENLERDVAKLTGEKRDLEAQVADLNDRIDTIEDEKAKLREEIASKENVIKDLQDRLKRRNPTDDSSGAMNTSVALTIGDKGKVIESNDEYKFAIIEFSPSAMMEMLGPERDKQFPQLDMSIRRIGRESAAGDFVTKIKLRNTVKDKNIVVADILTDFQQSPVEKGDVVYF